MAEVIIDGRQLKPEEILLQRPSEAETKEIKRRLAEDPGSLCLSDFANDDCRKCHGSGKLGRYPSNNQPVVCGCVYKNFVRNTWFKPKQIMARLTRESKEHKPSDGIRTEASDPPKVIASAG